MTAPRGKRSAPRGRAGTGPAEPDTRPPPAGRVPDLLRRVVGMGFSGLFLGEEVVRKALGDTVPRDWVDFAAAQSERTRRELIDRVAAEVGRTLDAIDLPGLAERLLRGHAIEVSARLRFVPREDDEAAAGGRTRGRSLRLSFADEEDEA
jgi:hypothetical protein